MNSAKLKEEHRPAPKTTGGDKAHVQRQLPRPSDLRALLQFKSPTLDPVQRRLEAAITIEDLRQISRRTTPRSVFDYVDGGADYEVSQRRNKAVFDTARFMPNLLHEVSDPDLSTELLGRRIGFPVVFAPTGFTRMMHHEGEIAVARVAERNNLPYALSLLGTTDYETVAAAAPHGDNWFQMYMTNNQSLNTEILDKALEVGATTLVLTIDCAVGGFRPKDVRNGLAIPPALTMKTFFNMARFPYWWLNKLTTPPVEFASVRDFPGTNMEVAKLLFDPNLNYEALTWLRSHWPHKLLVKGIVNPADAGRMMEYGADGVIISNHGGRQLDRTPGTMEVLPAVREVVGAGATVMVDGGIMHGQDIIAARAAGADAVMIGRAYLYGIMAAGERGVERAVEILRDEFQRGLQLLGLRSTDAIASRHVVWPVVDSPTANPEAASLYRRSQAC
ncbi:Putative L-lactate dehydrogenase [Propionicimonas sp. T2.31MG-18]|uniref:alpha-hydroxy acid oxidase n=1 Tax=Propionicimonas sp. T2.31MG-18 TaxID=3157620 RepID=UPI0035EADDAF